MTETARTRAVPSFSTATTGTPSVRETSPRVAPDSTSVTSEQALGCRIDVSGRIFTVELEMAGIFLRQVRQTLRAADGGLVLLRHVDGIEMIPFTRATPFEVLDIICPEGVDPAQARADAGLRAR